MGVKGGSKSRRCGRRREEEGRKEGRKEKLIQIKG